MACHESSVCKFFLESLKECFLCVLYVDLFYTLEFIFT